MEKRLEDFACESIRFKVTGEQGAPLKLGASKVGGCPDVIEGFEWPRDKMGRPLSLLLQINCSDVSKIDKTGVLPASGCILFFYELEEMDYEGVGGSIRLYYFEEGETLIRVECPSDLHDNLRIKERALSFEKRMSYPSCEDYITLLSDGEEPDYDVLETEYNEAKNRLGGLFKRQEGDVGSMLGYADLLQNYMVDDLENNVLLMQMFSFRSGDCELMFGDEGCVYLYISKEALKAKDFSELKFEMQCL